MRGRGKLREEGSERYMERTRDREKENEIDNDNKKYSEREGDIDR